MNLDETHRLISLQDEYESEESSDSSEDLYEALALLNEAVRLLGFLGEEGPRRIRRADCDEMLELANAIQDFTEQYDETMLPIGEK